MEIAVAIRFIFFGLGWIIALSGQGCSVDSARNHYLLGEKLWTDQKYTAAVSEFEKVIVKDPRGNFGLQAMFRAATTQCFFLSRYPEAIRQFQNFIQLSGDPSLIWDAEVQIGEILYSKTEQYDLAIQHYRTLLSQRHQAPEAGEFLFRIAKSHYFLFHFDEAVATYRELIQTFPRSHLAEKAMYEIGVTYLARGLDSYDLAKSSFEKFMMRYPRSSLVTEAKFGIASCLEELDLLGDAYKAFAALKGSYLSPDVIEVKLNRIQQRMSLRSALK